MVQYGGRCAFSSFPPWIQSAYRHVLCVNPHACKAMETLPQSNLLKDHSQAKNASMLLPLKFIITTATWRKSSFSTDRMVQPFLLIMNNESRTPILLYLHPNLSLGPIDCFCSCEEINKVLISISKDYNNPCTTELTKIL